MTEIFTDEELTAEFIGESPDLDEAAESVKDEEYTEPDSGFIDKTYRPPLARSYEKKIRKILNGVMRLTVQKESTLADGAALIMYAPQVAEKTGDLAAADKRVRRGIDWITEGTENPYLAFAFATMPLVMQLYRNHQDQLAPSAIVQTVKSARAEAKDRPGRTFRIPFTKRTITIRFRFQGVENLTDEPAKLVAYVFDNPNIQEALAKAEIKTAYNGHPPTATKRTRTR